MILKPFLCLGEVNYIDALNRLRSFEVNDQAI